MDLEKILAGLDQEIARLEEARALLAGQPTREKNIGKRRPLAPFPVAKKRGLTPEGRKRIAEAMTRRWAQRRKTTAKATK